MDLDDALLEFDKKPWILEEKQNKDQKTLNQILDGVRR